MVLSDRQKEELNRAVLDYLVSSGYQQVCLHFLAWPRGLRFSE